MISWALRARAEIGRATRFSRCRDSRRSRRSRDKLFVAGSLARHDAERGHAVAIGEDPCNWTGSGSGAPNVRFASASAASGRRRRRGAAREL
jgi:hypothetical protein